MFTQTITRILMFLLMTQASWAYTVAVAFKPDANVTNESVTVKAVVHCSGFASKQKIVKNLIPNGLHELGPLDCPEPSKREATDLYLNEIPVMADFDSPENKVNFCITAYSANRVAGYRASQSYAHPCDAPDPVARRSSNPYSPEDTFKWVQDFAPIIFLHEDERFYPANPLDYINKAGLYDAQNQTLIQEGKLDVDSLIQTGQQKTDYVHHADKAGMYKAARCFAFPRQTADGNAIDISYWLFYEFNGAPDILGVPYNPETGIGHHYGDWEHMTVRATKDGHEIIGIHYAAHGKEEGTWHLGQVNNPEKAYIKNDKIYKRYSGYQLNDKGQPIVFSAKFTHAMYNRSGIIPREITKQLSNDVTGYGSLIDCSDPGKLVIITDPDANNSRLIDTSEPVVRQSQWLLFPGYWGKEGSLTPRAKGIWWDEVK